MASILLPIWRFGERHRCLGAISRCKHVIVTDTSMLRLVQSTRPGLRLRVGVVPNFTDLADGPDGGSTALETHPAVEALFAARRQGAIVVLVPRNLSFVRGGAWLPEIVVRTLASSPAGRNCHFFLTGVPVNVYGGAGRYRRLFEQQLSSLSAEARAHMHMLGGVPHAWMRAAYWASDLVLVPTFAHEGTPLAAIEAMGAGRAVVATNVGGLNDLVADHVTGLLALPDPVALAAAVAELAKDPDLRARLGAEGSRRVRAMYTEERWRTEAQNFGRRAGWATGARGN
jgi:glycosyltransferase involved in cell wall biosynthesis